MTEYDHIVEFLGEFNLKVNDVQWNKPKNDQGSLFMTYVKLEKSIQTNPLSLYSDEIILKALKEGANPNVINNQDQTPLHLAASPYTVAHLINYGADIHLKDKKGKTAFYYLMEDALHGVHFDFHLEKMKILILNGAKIEDEHWQKVSTYRYKEKLTELLDLAKVSQEKNELNQNLLTKENDLTLKTKLKL
jgi:ankyrin repeat protein